MREFDALVARNLERRRLERYVPAAYLAAAIINFAGKVSKKDVDVQDCVDHLLYELATLPAADLTDEQHEARENDRIRKQLESLAIGLGGAVDPS